MDDKCHKCGDWTRAAYARYSGLFHDGTELTECECDETHRCDCEDCTCGAESRVWDEATVTILARPQDATKASTPASRAA